MSARPYRFDSQLKRFTSSTAQGLIAEATRESLSIREGYKVALGKGIAAACLTVTFAYALFVFPPFALAFLACAYFTVVWVRQGTDKLRVSRFDKMFVADVVRYARQVAGSDS